MEYRTKPYTDAEVERMVQAQIDAGVHEDIAWSNVFGIVEAQQEAAAYGAGFWA